MLPYESCNLASVNLANMTKQEHGEIKIDWDRLQETVGTGVHLLDNVIDMNRYPIPEIERMTMQTRRIGLGVMGLADLLVQLGIRYDSQEALEATGEVMAYIHEMTHMASGMLAQKRDPFPAWSKSIYGESDPPRTMRNSAPTTIAPTGTISIIAGTSSGIEPLFALAYVRNVMDKTKLVEVNPVFSLVARNEGFYSEELMEQLVQTGTLEGTKVPEWVKEVFRTSHDIDPQWHVLMQAAVQKHTDNAVSKTINFPHDATREEIATACMTAYDLKCKGITVYRDGSKDQQVLSTGQTKQAGSEAQGDTVRAEPNGHVTPRQRPRSTRGVTERVRTGHGNMYVTINFDDNDEPFEVFGNLGKAGGCDSAQLEAISRLASLALRSGIEPSEILDQIRGITCCPAWDDGVPVRSSPDALALALERYTKGWPERNGGQDPEITQIPLPVAQTTGSRRTITRLAGPKCPDCNTQVMFQEGCPTCPSCGWSRCE